MHKGHNSDITVRGQRYHIQTEDWGKQNPFVVSRVFCNGAVLKTIKTPYGSIAPAGLSFVNGNPHGAAVPNSAATFVPDDAIKAAVQKQHEQIIDILMAGGQP